MKIRTFQGFTLIELVLVMSIFLTLVAMTVPTLLGSRERTDISTTMSTVIGDIKGQQLKAMISDTEGRDESSAYGVHFETDSYTLFHGSSYIASEPSNSVVPLGGSVQFDSVEYPERQIVFIMGSGEVQSYVGGIDSFSLRNTNNGEIRLATLNQYGVFTEVD